MSRILNYQILQNLHLDIFLSLGPKDKILQILLEQSLKNENNVLLQRAPVSQILVYMLVPYIR